MIRIIGQRHGFRPDIVTRGQGIRTEFPSRRQQVGKLDGLVAGHAGDRRFAGDIAVHERVDHRVAEALFVVQHVMGNAKGSQTRRASSISWPAQQDPAGAPRRRDHKAAA